MYDCLRYIDVNGRRLKKARPLNIIPVGALTGISQIVPPSVGNLSPD